MQRYFHNLRIPAIVLCVGVAGYFGAGWLQGQQANTDGLTAENTRERDIETASTSSSASATDLAALRDPGLQLPKRQPVLTERASNAFSLLLWVDPPKPAPPPPPAATVVVAAPVAPPLPYAFVGLVEQAPGVTRPKAFVSRGESLLVIAAGDTLDGNYSVDSISAQQIVLTYLPLKTRQTLTVSGATQ